jgi:hypothetical protein
MTKKERRLARHERRVSRRALLKGAGAAVAAVTASLFLPGMARMVHSEVVKTVKHPMWDRLLDHVSRQSIGFRAEDRRPELTRWIRGLVLCPKEPQQALLLVGPDCSGKTTFHQAMGLLLPPRAVVQFPEEMRYPMMGSTDDADARAQREARLKEAWLLAVREHPSLFVSLYKTPHFRAGRYLKWCLTWNQQVEWNKGQNMEEPGNGVQRLPPVQKYEVGRLVTTTPRFDLLRRLEDECNDFRATLMKAA